MLAKLRAFGAFWYDFVVGDDWRVAAGIVIAFAVTYGVSKTTVAVWWIAPVAVLFLLPFSLWRHIRRN